MASTEQGSKGRILAISQDEKHGQHWRKTHCTLHPFPIPSAQNRSGSGPAVQLDLPPASQTWGSLNPVPLQGPSTALCSASSNISLFPLLCSNCPSLGISGSLVNGEVQTRELPLPSPSSLYSPSTLLPGSGMSEFWGEAQFGWSCCFIRISFWAESLKRDKYT